MLEESIARLRSRYVEESREIYFSLFEAYDLSDDGATYADLADRFKLKETDVTNYLSRCRRRFRATVREVVRESLSDGIDPDGELAILFGERKPGGSL